MPGLDTKSGPAALERDPCENSEGPQAPRYELLLIGREALRPAPGPSGTAEWLTPLPLSPLLTYQHCHRGADGDAGRAARAQRP